ncbi:MAG: DUF3737 family protein [Clostridia bacterium]|nr:DUF3737 family protein [Clostridia bacterium]
MNSRINIENKSFDEERALYESHGITVRNVRFEGPLDGESALKESSDIIVEDSFFDLRYPFWHDEGLKIKISHLTEKCRAALWYSSDITVENSKLFGTKALRECSDVTIENCEVRSDEFGWSVKKVIMKDTCVSGEYFMMRSRALDFKNVTLDGKYSFQYIEDSVIDGCNFKTKDAFWHAKNTVIRNSVVAGEYLAWYSEGLTFENCIITGTQPFCYCKGLKLINCEMHGADLAFERSEVDAEITTPVISIKNPTSGTIKLPTAGELIDCEGTKCRIVMKEICRSQA